MYWDVSLWLLNLLTVNSKFSKMLKSQLKIAGKNRFYLKFLYLNFFTVHKRDLKSCRNLLYAKLDMFKYSHIRLYDILSTIHWCV